MIISYCNIIVAVKCKIFTEATILKTTEETASVASNIATALGEGRPIVKYRDRLP